MGVAWLEEAGHWGCDLEELIPHPALPPLSSLPDCREVSSFSSEMALCLYHPVLELEGYKLKPLQIGANTSLSSFNLQVSSTMFQ